MSGKPWPEGAQQVIDLIEMGEILLQKITRLTPIRAELEEALAAYNATQTELRTLLRSMDVHSEQHGHFGWEARMAWLLGEMRRRIVTPPTPETTPSATALTTPSDASRR